MNGCYPWFSVDAGASEVWLTVRFPVPDEDEVTRCMNCPYEDCRDCINGGAEKKAPHRPLMYDEALIRRLVSSGKSNKEICNEVGCSRATAIRYRKRMVITA